MAKYVAPMKMNSWRGNSNFPGAAKTVTTGTTGPRDCSSII